MIKSVRKTAILVDGGFYRRRAQTLFGDVSAEERADELVKYCARHLSADTSEKRELYRIFYYDCPPLLRMQIDFGKSDLYSIYG